MIRVFIYINGKIVETAELKTFDSVDDYVRNAIKRLSKLGDLRILIVS